MKTTSHHTAVLDEHEISDLASAALFGDDMVKAVPFLSGCVPLPLSFPTLLLELFAVLGLGAFNL